MDSIRQYILSVICITIACGVVQQLLAGSQHYGIMRIITGLMVTISVLHPFLNLNDFSFDLCFDQITSDGAWIAEEGERMAADMVADIIRESTAAYISDKASVLGASVNVEVELDNDMVSRPSRVTVIGNLSPYVKKQLSTYIQKELGISEDAQIWIS